MTLSPVLIAVLPALVYAFVRLRRTRLRWLAAAPVLVLLAILVALWPKAGVDFVQLPRLKLLLAGAACALLVLRASRAPWIRDGRRYRLALSGLAAASVVVYLNFFAFHGARVFLHLHDIANYYLGSKYFAELGHTGLYTAIVRAEAEAGGGPWTGEARHLALNEVVTVRSLLAESEAVKAAFTPERWAEFRRDTLVFRQALGPEHWGVLLSDHGYNATPLWTLIGGSLANRIRLDDGAGLRLLALVDPLLLAAAFLAVLLTFGIDTCLLAILHFCLIYGAEFDWTGGAFLRYLWFAALVGFACALARRRHAVAGALLALSTALRVFPIAFLAGVLARSLRGRPRMPPSTRRLLTSFAAAGLALFLATLAAPHGVRAWGEFETNMAKHLRSLSPNLVGATPVLAYRPTPELVTREELREIERRRTAIRRAQLVLLLLPALALLARAAPRVDELTAAALGFLPLFFGLDLAAYYYVALVILTLAWRERPAWLAALFGLELATYAIVLLEKAPYAFLYRDVLLATLLVASSIEALRRARIAPMPVEEGRA